MSGRLALRDALDAHAERTISRHQAIYRGNITKLKPLTVDVFGFDIPLTLDDDFELSQWAAFYHQNVGLQVDDLVLMHQELQDWSLVDVVSDADVTGGMRQKLTTKITKPSFVTFASIGLFGTNWSDYGTYARGGYAIDQLGFCTVRGLVKKTSTYANGDVIATLPMHPSDGPEIFDTRAADSVMGAFAARIDVSATGTIILNAADSTPSYSTPASMAYLSLSGIRFQVA